MVATRQAGRSPDSVDRILLTVCAVIWLAVIGVSVAAIVVLVDMGTGRHGRGSAGSHTPWLLYAVIAVSALIIVGAIPLLVRARRSALGEASRPPLRPSSAQRAGGAPAAPMPPEAPTEKLRVFGSIADPIDRRPPAYRSPQPAPRRVVGGLSTATVERMWLRATVVISGAMGVAMLAVATATYLMGVDKNTLAWTAYGFAAVVTAAMPVATLLYLRQLRTTVGTGPH
jgi:Protein of unknown function (DUF2561)